MATTYNPGTAASRQRRYSAENVRIAESLTAGGHPRLAAAYLDAAVRHTAAGDALDAASTGEREPEFTEDLVKVVASQALAEATGDAGPDALACTVEAICARLHLSGVVRGSGLRDAVGAELARRSQR